MVKRDLIRNMSPGQRLEVQCDDAADLDSTYQTAWQMRKELEIDRSEMLISRSAANTRVVVEYLKK